MTHQWRWRQFSKTLFCALVGLGVACSPSAPAPVPTPVPKAVGIGAVGPVAGRPAEQTAIRIFGSGFQAGAIVTLDGIARPATVVGDSTIDTTAPPHPPGAIDIVITNPDGGTGRMDKAFTYIESLLPAGDITIGPGDSVVAMLGPGDAECTFESIPCRRLFIRASADEMVEVELVRLDRRESFGLYDEPPSRGPTDFPKRLVVRGGQQVWIMGEYALFRLTARVQT